MQPAIFGASPMLLWVWLILSLAWSVCVNVCFGKAGAEGLTAMANVTEKEKNDS